MLVACTGILSDLFPGVSLPEMDYTHLRAALVANAGKQGLQPLPTFLEKAIQLYEMIVVRLATLTSTQTSRRKHMGRPRRPRQRASGADACSRPAWRAEAQSPKP